MDSLWCLDIMDPKSKAPTPTPPYRQDANKKFLPSDDHAGPEPFGYALRSFICGKRLDGTIAAFRLEAVGMEYESDPPDSDDDSIARPTGRQGIMLHSCDFQ